MSTTYTLRSGPCKKDLLLSLTDHKKLTFRGFDNTKHSHIFEVVIRKLGILGSDHTQLRWNFDGYILRKNGQKTESKRCNALFDSRSREGYFYEHERVKKYSYEYFKSLSPEELSRQILRLRDSVPEDLAELKKYIEGLNPHEQLVLEALHTWKLIEACSGVKISHELDLQLTQELQGTRS